MKGEKRETHLRWMVLCCGALAVLELTTVYQFSGSWSWDWVVHTAPSGVVVLAVGLVLLVLAGGLTWRIGSPSGDQDLRNYWIYCAVLMGLCLLRQDLDTSLHMLFVLVAMVSTPLGIVGAGLGARPDGAGHTLCYGVMLALSAAEVLYYHWLLCRHKAQKQTAAEGGN